MGMNKKGQKNTYLLVLLTFLVISVVGVGAWMVFKTPQTAVQPAVTPEQQTQASIDTNLGKTVSLKARAVDYASSSLTQVFPPLYCWNINAPTNLIEDAQSMGTSGDTSVDGISVGQTVKCVAFNNSYASQEAQKTADVQSPPTLEIRVDRIAIDMAIQMSKDAVVNSPTRGSANLTIGSASTDSLDNMRIKNNGTNQVFNFYGVVFDTADSGTNLTLISMNAPLVRGSSLERLSGTSEFVWAGTPTGLTGTRNDNRGRNLPAGYIADGQYVDLGGVTVTTKGSFSGANTEELVIVRLLDKAQYKAVQGALAGSIQTGAEDDASTRTNVGARDFDSSFSVLT